MNLVWAAGAAVSAAAAVFAAAHHPLWPAPIAAALAAWMLVAYRFAGAWLFMLPACLPVLNFSPWTGWIGIEEFDLLVLASVAGGYARLAGAHEDLRDRLPAAPFGQSLSTLRTHWSALAVASITLLGLQRGINDAGGWDLAWYQGYAEPLNSLRVGKSALHVLLLLPLLGIAWRADRARAFRRFAQGMVCGAGVLTLAVLWERAAFPGLFNLLAHYRTVGLFWEMHVGGAAIDAYVVLATPFVAWALWAARTKWAWLAAALFALLWAYAVMTTFSRGAYLGVATSLLVLGLQLPMTGGQRWWPAARALAFVVGAALLLGLVLDGWGYGAAALASVALGAMLWLRWRVRAVRRQRSLAASMLLLALVFEAAVMLGPDSFMNARMARNAADYESRTAHWGRGIALLEAPADWLFGLGLGRLPAHYDRHVPGGEFSGSVMWQDAGGGDGHVRIAGPRTRAALGGRFGLTQRVPLAEAYRVQMDLRSVQAVTVFVRVCESHLLYDRGCQAAFVRLPPSRDAAAWQQRSVVLRGPPLSAGRAIAPRQGVFTLAVLDTGSEVDFDNLIVETRLGQRLLDNGDFAAGLAHWLPAAQVHFTPWHIDNLYLELLIERGLIGTLLLLGLGAVSLQRLLRRPEPGDISAPFIAASLCGVTCVGLMSSVLDVPRVALLVALLLAMGLLRVK